MAVLHHSPYFYGLLALITMVIIPVQMPVFNEGPISVRASATENENPNRLLDAFSAGQNLILEKIAAGASLPEVLTMLLQLIEAQTSGLLCSILLVDEDGLRLRHGAAPSLCESYIKAVDGLSVGPNSGSCGTAVHRKETVVVTDTLKDPLWGDYRQLALD